MKLENNYFTFDGDIEYDINHYLNAQPFLTETLRDIYELDDDAIIAFYHMGYDLVKISIPDKELNIFLRYVVPSSCFEEYRYEIIWQGSLTDATTFLSKTKKPIEKKQIN